MAYFDGVNLKVKKLGNFWEKLAFFLSSIWSHGQLLIKKTV